MAFNDLKSNQQNFVNFMANQVIAGNLEPNDGVFSRNMLNAIAKSNGMRVAPAWITTDPARRVGRGSYRVSELVERVTNLSTQT